MAMFFRSSRYPPALPRQTIGLAYDQDSKLGLAARFGLGVDRAEHHAQRTHLGPRKGISQVTEQFGISDRTAFAGASD
jgi:hypothetical protein